LDQTIKLWDVASGVELRTLKGHSHYVTSVSFSPDGRQIVSGSADNKVKLWDAESGEELRTLNGHTSSVRSVAFSPDGRRIVSGSLDQTIKLWDSESGDELKTLKGHSGSVESVASSPDGRRIISGSYDRTIKLWYGTPLDNEAHNRQLLAEFWRPKPNSHLSLARVAAASQDWYAATFQSAWAVKLQPESAENRSLFTDAYKKMVEKYGGTIPPTPPIVAEAIAITKSTPSGDATRLPTPQPPNPVPSSDSNPNAKTFVNGIGAKMVLIPAGTFLMGSPKSDSEASGDEKPQHAVTLTRSFYMGATEVTQGQWKAVMGTEPWKGQGSVRKGANYPATYVSWDEAVEYCRRLSDREGREYRLPTEAEWEYACRGGKSTKYSFGDDATLLPQYAWFADNADKINAGYAHLVQQKLVNPFGLYDMHGNVWEWCSDWYGDYTAGPATDPEGPGEGANRVLRGGDWDYDAAGCRAANRSSYAPTYRNTIIGLRLALVSVSQ
jgi:formylglycine-generating enzyme required for sulfatase activity